MSEKLGLRSIVTRLIGAFEEPGITDTTAARQRLVRQLVSPHRAISMQALDTLRYRGWLADGTLHGADLQRVYFNGTDLEGASLQMAQMAEAHLCYTNLRSANLSGANLRGANLTGSDLRHANLDGTNLEHAFILEADLTGVDLTKAQIAGARLGTTDLLHARITAEQCFSLAMLNGARMPDGTHYDGRFNLVGDLQLATFLEIIPDDIYAMASFYDVTPEEYRTGQVWRAEFAA